MKPFVAILLLVSAIAASAKLPVIQGRCASLGDVVEKKDVPGRIRWAEKCRREYQSYYDAIKELDETPYPTFGVFNEKDGSASNPMKQYAGVSDEETCTEIPEDYVLIGFCVR